MNIILDPCVSTINLLKHISRLCLHALHWMPYSKTTCRNCLWESWSFWGFPGFSTLPGCWRDLGEEIRLEAGESPEFCKDRQGNNVRDRLRRMTTTHQNEDRAFKDFLFVDMIGDRKNREHAQVYNQFPNHSTCILLIPQKMRASWSDRNGSWVQPH